MPAEGALSATASQTVIKRMSRESRYTAVTRVNVLLKREKLVQRYLRNNPVSTSAQHAASARAVPLEGLEPPTLSLGRNCSSIELQRLTARVYLV